MPYDSYDNKVREKNGTQRANADVKKSFIAAFEELGGTEGLVAWAKESSANKKAFYQWIARMLPREHNVNSDPLQNVTFKIEGIDGSKNSD